MMFSVSTRRFYALLWYILLGVAGASQGALAAPFQPDLDELLSPTQSAESQPLLRILYTASTKGELHPCPT